VKATILIGDARKRLAELPDGSVRTCVTSPPYFGLRDYGHEGQMGLEETPEAYVNKMVELFREVRRVLADDGTVWLNIGDSYVGGKGQSGQDSPKFQAQRAAEGVSINQAYHQIAGKKQTRPTDNRAKMREAGLKPKDLIGIPWRVAFALQEDGWYLRQDIIWAKPNPMPESVRDRCTRSHEYVFLLSKSPRYYYDHEAVKEDAVTGSWDAMPPIGGVKQTNGNDNRTYSGNTPENNGKRNRRDVWTIATKPFRGAHFAVMPEALVEPCVLAGTAEGDTVLDPFTGSGTVAVVSLRHGRNFVGTELNPEYGDIARERITNDAPLMNEVEIL
jgi:DNA modification methylase